MRKFFIDNVRLCYKNLNALFDYYHQSVSSRTFYRNIYLNYEGYGFRYIFLTALISSILLLPSLCSKLNDVKSYLYYQDNEQNVNNLHYILNQFNGVEYKGRAIQYINNDYVFIKDLFGKNVILIDPDEKYKGRHDARMVFTKYYLRFSNEKKIHHGKLNFQYKNFFGRNRLNFDDITNENFYNLVVRFFKLVPYLFIFIYTCCIFVHHILNNILFTVFFYLIMRFFIRRITFSAATRLVMFASGLQLLFYSSIVVIFPFLYIVEKGIGYITTVLLVIAMMKYKNNL